MSQRGRWGTRGLDAVVIVTSILLAFSIDALWDKRQERVQRAELLAGLCSDFVTTRSLLATSLESGEMLLRHNRALQAATSGGAPVPADSLPTFVLHAVNAGAFTPATANYEAAIASGSISLIESDPLLIYLNLFDAGLEGYRQFADISGQYYFFGPLQAVTSEFGGFEALRRSRELAEVVRRPAFRAIVEHYGNLQGGAVYFLSQMDTASVAVTEELRCPLGTR